VAFRAFVRRSAEALDLSGWVRNRLDGSVEVLAHGAPQTLDELRRLLLQGSRWSRVDHVEVDTVTPDEHEEHSQAVGFSIIRTA
jgi:acylphosphatase